jgi:hypothetical protein
MKKKKKVVYCLFQRSAAFPISQKYWSCSLQFFQTEQLGQRQSFFLTVSLAFPLAQKAIPLSFDSAKVGQPGQMHFFVFSVVSGTVTPNFQLHLHSQLKRKNRFGN